MEMMGKDVAERMYWYQSRQGRFVVVEPSIEGKRIALGSMRELQEHRAEARLGELWQIDRPPSRNPRYFFDMESGKWRLPARHGGWDRAYTHMAFGFAVGLTLALAALVAFVLEAEYVWASGIVALGSLGGQWQVSRLFVAYEMTEDDAINDEEYRDIGGYTWGVAGGNAVSLSLLTAGLMVTLG